MKSILSENQMAQLEEIGDISVDDLRRMLQDVDATEVDAGELYEELKRRGVNITEVAPPDLPRRPQSSEATPSLLKDELQNNG